MRLSHVAFAIYAGSVALSAQAPSKPPAEPAAVSLKGCVTKLPKVSRYVLASGDKCYLLNSDYRAEDVVGKTITLRGIVVQPLDMDPLRLQVTRGGPVGEACALSCTPQPPDDGTRGSPHGKERPGSEAGRPGMKPQEVQP